MRGGKNASHKNLVGVRRRLRRLLVPLPQADPEFAQRSHARLEALQHMGRELSEMFGILLDAVEDRRLDVRDDQPVQIIGDAAFHDAFGHGHAAMRGQGGRVLLPQEAGRQHLVGLLVQFHQFHGAQLVVPAQKIGPGKYQLQQTFPQCRHRQKPPLTVPFHNRVRQEPGKDHSLPGTFLFPATGLDSGPLDSWRAGKGSLLLLPH